MAANAKIGYGSQFQRGNGGSPEVFTALAGVNLITPPSLSRETIDVTDYASPGRWREFIGGLRDAGEMTIELDYLRGGAADAALVADFLSNAPRNYRIVFPDGEPPWVFSAILTDYEVALPMDDKQSATATFKLTGAGL